MSGFVTISVSNILMSRLIASAERYLCGMMLHHQAFSPQQIDAVLALRPQRLNDVKKRLGAVRAFAALPEAESLAATNKRVGNILKKAGSAWEARSILGYSKRRPKGVAPGIVPHRAESRYGICGGRLHGSLQMLAA